MRQVCYQLCQTYPIISTAATNHEQENGAERHPAQLRPLTFQGCSSDNRKVCVGPSVFVNLRPAALASYHDNHETAHRQHHPTLLLLSPAAKTPPQIFLMNKELFSVDTSRQTQLFPAAHVGDGEISSSSSRSTSSLHTPKHYGTSYKWSINIVILNIHPHYYWVMSGMNSQCNEQLDCLLSCEGECIDLNS